MSESYLIKQKKDDYLEYRKTLGFADRYPKSCPIENLRTQPIDDQEHSTAGRITALRHIGKLMFAVLYDASGQIQICLEQNILGEELFQRFKKNVAIGDHVGCRGTLFYTQKGELTLRVVDWTLLNKAVRPFPEKFHGIQDREFAFRHRYLDVIFNVSTRLLMKRRVEMIRAMRNCLDNEGFWEFETPIIQTEVSGASAKPFLTYHEALNLECNLRIACETYLKRCIAAGFDKVYEFSRVFRNEGLSTQHLQEFTILEIYVAYYNYQDLKNFVQRFLKETIQKSWGTLVFNIDDDVISLEGEWPTVTYHSLFEQYLKLDLQQYRDVSSVRQWMIETQHTLKDVDDLEYGPLLDQIYKKWIRPHLKGPLFVTHYPSDQLPLARVNLDNAQLADSVQLLLKGQEIVKLYSELVDPLTQRAFLTEQARRKAAGDHEAMTLDEDFLKAIEYGLPPTAGLGIGIDRLVALLGDCRTVREAVFFPLLRPEVKSES